MPRRAAGVCNYTTAMLPAPDDNGQNDCGRVKAPAFFNFMISINMVELDIKIKQYILHLDKPFIYKTRNDTWQ
jgi:hypothetical protein